MTFSELNSITKRAGNLAVREWAAMKANLTPDTVPLANIQEARRAPVSAIKEAFIARSEFELIPDGASFRHFRTGWRGSELVTHGKSTSYSLGCRCNDCREAWRQYQKKRRDRKTTETAQQQIEHAKNGTRTLIERGQAIEAQKAIDAWVASMSYDPWSDDNLYPGAE